MLLKLSEKLWLFFVVVNGMRSISCKALFTLATLQHKEKIMFSSSCYVSPMLCLFTMVTKLTEMFVRVSVTLPGTYTMQRWRQCG